MAEQQDQVQARVSHASVGTYVAIFGVLFVITLVEVGVFYVPALEGVLPPLLIVLSAAKFTLVVMFFMHLKYDHRVFTFLLSWPLFMAFALGIALTLLFGRFGFQF